MLNSHFILTCSLTYRTVKPEKKDQADCSRPSNGLLIENMIKEIFWKEIYGFLGKERETIKDIYRRYSRQMLDLKHHDARYQNEFIKDKFLRALSD